MTAEDRVGPAGVSASASKSASASRSASASGSESEPASEEFRTALRRSIGGPRGMFDSALPALVFVAVNAVTELRTAVAAALAAGLGVAALRLARKQSAQQAVGGLFGLAIAAVIALRTGEARGFFLPGILINVAYGAAFLVSVLVRRPLVGLLVGVLVEGTDGDRAGPTLRRVQTWATLGFAALFFVKAAVQGALYLDDRPGWLAVSRLAMGWPLYVAAIGLTALAVRRARRRDARARLAQDR